MRLILAVLLLAAGFAGGALATPITFVYTGSTAWGTLAGTPFADVDFTITATGDTADRQTFSNGFFIDHLSAHIDISGIGVLTFLTPTRTFVGNSEALPG